MKKTKEQIKYIFEVAHPKEDFKIRNKANSFEDLKKKTNINTFLPMGYFKGCKIRFRCVKMKGNKITKELEEYKYRNGRVYGYFTNWEKMGQNQP